MNQIWQGDTHGEQHHDESAYNVLH